MRARTAPPPAIYPGSFDPVTNGHLDVIRRAAALFPRLIVAVVANPQKTPLFALAEREAMLRESCHLLANVEIDRFEGLLADYVRRCGAGMVVSACSSRRRATVSAGWVIPSSQAARVRFAWRAMARK